jgi:hypothetical protein
LLVHGCSIPNFDKPVFDNSDVIRSFRPNHAQKKCRSM